MKEAVGKRTLVTRCGARVPLEGSFFIAHSWNTRTGRHRYGNLYTVLDSKGVQETEETQNNGEDYAGKKR